eukprot:gene35419-45892_t
MWVRSNGFVAFISGSLLVNGASFARARNAIKSHLHAVLVLTPAVCGSGLTVHSMLLSNSLIVHALPQGLIFPQRGQSRSDSSSAGLDFMGAATSNIMVSQDANITLTSLSSWLLLEEKIDHFYGFFRENVGTFKVKERQKSKVRVEIPVLKEGGVSFLALRADRIQQGGIGYPGVLDLTDQIFNQFAAQLEEDRRDR